MEQAIKHGSHVGLTKAPQGIAAGRRLALHDIWSAPGGVAEFKTFEAEPGRYPYTLAPGESRGFFEINAVMTGRVMVTKSGEPEIELRAGDTYVMEPGWSGCWDVREYMIKAVVWVHA